MDINVAKRDLSVPIFAAAMMLKMMDRSSDNDADDDHELSDVDNVDDDHNIRE